MADEPTVVGTTDQELFDRATAMAPFYTDGWEPRSGDVGTALLDLSSAMAANVAARIDRVPEKHRRSFFTALGFDRDPPQSSRLPLSVTVAEGVTDNIAVAAGTRAVAEATDERPERTFTIAPGNGFEATPARLERVYSVDRDADLIADHTAALASGSATDLFDGANAQRHVLYVGHAAMLDLAPGAVVRIAVEPASAASVLGALVWEYYGTGAAGADRATEALADAGGTTDGLDEEADATEGWYRLDAEREGKAIRLPIPDEAELVETTVAGRESRWLRCRIPAAEAVREGRARTPPADVFDLRVNAVRLRTGRGATDPNRALSPDALFHNDVPLPVESDGADLVPFGSVPRPLDAFYVASDEAFTKAGATATLEFHPRTGTDGGADRSDTPDVPPRLSWEYWTGDSWAKLDVSDATDRLMGPGTVTFGVPSDLEPTAPFGREAHWIRVRLIGEYVTFEYETDAAGKLTRTVVRGAAPRFGGLTVRYGAGGDGTDTNVSSAAPAALAPIEDSPTHLLSHNNLAYTDERPDDIDRPFAPFERPPDATQTLYLGFDAPLRDGPINLFVSVADAAYPETFYPRVRWEYARGPAEEWASIDVRDGTESFTERGIVALAFPETTVAVERFGETYHWIRARVDGDPFRSERAVAPTPGSLRVAAIDAERERVVIENASDHPIDLSGCRIDFEYGGARGQVRTFPAGTVVDSGRSLVVATGTKSIGTADVRFDYRRWVLNNVDPDSVAVLTPDGRDVVAMATDQLDAVSDTVDVDPAGPAVTTVDLPPDRAPCDSSAPASPPPCAGEETLETEPPAGGPTESPPTLSGLYPNTAWASNVRPVEDELLGSSDGTPSQTFAFSAPPVLAESVWVDEHGALSAGEREAIETARPDAVEAIRDLDGDLTAFWVRWRRVDDLSAAAANDRVYTLDATAGRLTVGDDVHGTIPPRGSDNVRASYDTGGGLAGNVPAGVVTDLVSSIPFVDGVTNPEAGDGGADAETTTAALVRAPRQLKHRDRAIAAADFERIALEASRKLARTRCLPVTDAAGERRLGWVTLLVVPNGTESKPTPSAELTERVFDALSERAPAVVVDRAPPRLVVRGPSYVEATVDVTVTAGETDSLAALEEAIAEGTSAFLHPLFGGPEGEGWAFGELPCLSEFYALLEGIEGVDHVEHLEVTFTGSGQSITVTEGEESPRVARGVLVCAGTHAVRTVARDAVETTGGTR